MIRKLGLLVGTLAVTAGCAAPLVPIDYAGETKLSTDHDANVTFNSGAVIGYPGTSLSPIGRIFVARTSGPNPKLQFNPSDQRVFIDSLKNELVRLGLVGSMAEGGNGSLKIRVNFVHTAHFPTFQEYQITASLLMRSGKLIGIKRYHILSSEGDSIWTKLGTSAAAGKKKAATKLMDQIIPDIEFFLTEVEGYRGEPESLPPDEDLKTI